MSIQAFQAQGPTILVPAAGSAPAGVACPTDTGFAPETFLMVNVGSETAYVNRSGADSSGNAQAAAVIPTAGNSENVIPLLPNSGIIISGINAQSASVPYFSAVTATGTADVFITPGEGQ